MFGIGKLRSALATLAGEVEALACTVREVNGGIRSTLSLDAPSVPRTGEVIDGSASALPGPEDAAEGQPEAANGKRARSRR